MEDINFITESYDKKYFLKDALEVLRSVSYDTFLNRFSRYNRDTIIQNIYQDMENSKIHLRSLRPSLYANELETIRTEVDSLITRMRVEATKAGDKEPYLNLMTKDEFVAWCLLNVTEEVNDNNTSEILPLASNYVDNPCHLRFWLDGIKSLPGTLANKGDTYPFFVQQIAPRDAEPSNLKDYPVLRKLVKTNLVKAFNSENGQTLYYPAYLLTIYELKFVGMDKTVLFGAVNPRGESAWFKQLHLVQGEVHLGSQNPLFGILRLSISKDIDVLNKIHGKLPIKFSDPHFEVVSIYKLRQLDVFEDYLHCLEADLMYVC